MLSRHPRLNGEDVNGMNAIRFQKNRLFSLIAQNCRHGNAQIIAHPDAIKYHHSSKLDRNASCNNLFRASDLANVSICKRLSRLISKHHRSKFVPTSESHRDAKFKWCFNLARSLTVTVRALIIKGVSPVLIVMTQKSLFSQQSKPESKVHQIDPLVTESAPSSRQIRGSVSLCVASPAFPPFPFFIKVAKGIVQPKFYKRWPQLCRVLRRSLLTTIFDEFSGISVVIKFGIFHE